MAEFLEEASGLESTTVGIYRTAATVKGGRRFSFAALVVVGDRNGNVGLGYGKAPGVPAAIEKAQKAAKKQMKRVNLIGGTIPHEITGRFAASKVKLIPASPGTGVIAGGTVRAVLELAGVRDCLTKSMGSNNQKNLSKAAMDGLTSIATKATIAELRGVDLGETIVEEKIKLGERYAPTSTVERVPVKKKEDDRGKGRGGKGRGGQQRGGNRGGQQRGGGRGPQAQAPKAEQPKPESQDNTPAAE